MLIGNFSALTIENTGDDKFNCAIVIELDPALESITLLCADCPTFTSPKSSVLGEITKEPVDDTTTPDPHPAIVIPRTAAAVESASRPNRFLFNP
jgi:hypothetical protein